MFREKRAAQPGDLVKDLVTGFEGIVTSRTTWLHGCDRMIVQPQKLTADGKPVEDSAFDEDRLKIVKKAKIAWAAPSEEEIAAFPLGAEAKDDLTGFKGIISGLTVNLSGNIHVFLEPCKLDKDGKAPELQGFNSTRVSITKPKPVPRTSDKTTGKDGGPQRGERASVR